MDKTSSMKFKNLTIHKNINSEDNINITEKMLQKNKLPIFTFQTFTLIKIMIALTTQTFKTQN